jgi:endonuclease/exonuclease/phosphatase family metal-dependent hydrolase
MTRHLARFALLGIFALVLFCSGFSTTAKRTLRVMTYNIHVGVGMDKKLDLQRIADVINKEKPDLVGLQEVDRGVKRTEGKDEIAELAAMTKMEFAFAPNLDYRGGNFVTAHLDYQFEDGRLFETEQLLKFVEAAKGPLIVVADLNDTPDGSAYKLMRRTFGDAWIASKANGDGFSYPADKPSKRIDHIFYRDRVRAKKAWVEQFRAKAERRTPGS